MSRRPSVATTTIVDPLTLETRNRGSMSTRLPSSLKTALTSPPSWLLQVNSKRCHGGTSMDGGVIVIGGWVGSEKQVKIEEDKPLLFHWLGRLGQLQ